MNSTTRGLLIGLSYSCALTLAGCGAAERQHQAEDGWGTTASHALAVTNAATVSQRTADVQSAPDSTAALQIADGVGVEVGASSEVVSDLSIGHQTVLTPTRLVAHGDNAFEPLDLPLHADRTATYFPSWVPRWATDSYDSHKSRIDIVQGPPGYSLIAGKNTLVAFTPYPSGMDLDHDAAWLDVYKLHPWGAEYPTLSHIQGTPVGDAQQCDSHGDRCAEINFLVDGAHLEEPGDYWFVVTWRRAADQPSITDSAVVRFDAPAVTKVLFVPVNGKQITTASVQDYFSRMPFASNAIEELGPSGRYWDIYPETVAIDLNACDPYELCRIKGPIGEALEAYNADAPVKADLAVGIFNGNFCGDVGCASGSTALCDTPNACTHEIGHLLDPTEEPWDRSGSKNTCGYFYRETDGSVDCQDWAYDVKTDALFGPSGTHRPTNTMSWFRGTQGSFYTRHFYETVCIALGGGCDSTRGTFRLETLDTARYLLGDGSARSVALTTEDALETLSATESVSWSAEVVRQSGDRTYVSLYRSGGCPNAYCPFTMLIGNPQTNELTLTDPAYYEANPGQFLGWCDEWELEQVAADIVTLDCQSSVPGKWFLKWDEAGQSQPGLGHPDDMNAEHWTPGFQWRIVKAKPYAGYPD